MPAALLATVGLAAPAALVLGFLLAGLAGLAVAVACVAGSFLVRRRRRWTWAPAVAGLLAAAGLLQAVVAPGLLGDPVLEGSVRLLCVAALVLVVSGSWRGPTPSADAPPRAP
jgi:arabinofuranan 3-O-arabinosyltransferase